MYLPDSRHQPSVTSTSPRQMAHRRPNGTFISLRPLRNKNKLKEQGSVMVGVLPVLFDPTAHIAIPNPEYITDAVFTRG
jgi:hypothetical protein